MTDLEHVPEHVVVDAAAIVDLLVGSEDAESVQQRLQRTVLHAPAHVDAEVLSALGRLNRAGEVDEVGVGACLAALRRMPVTRHTLPALLSGAWARRAAIRLLDALYVELAEQLDAALITTDVRLARTASRAEVPGKA